MGVTAGVPMRDAVELGSATLGDCSGDCSVSLKRLRYSAIIGGSKGVDASSCRSIGLNVGSGISMSAGFIGLERFLGQDSTFSSDCQSTGVTGGVTSCPDSMCAAIELLRDGSLEGEALEGGAHCALTSETGVVGLRSLQRAEIDGQRRFSREVSLSLF